MAQHYDLQEQEQIAMLKAFWARWGTIITVATVVVLAAVLGSRGYFMWQAKAAASAAQLADQVALAVEQNQNDSLAQDLGVLQSQYGKTVQATQASLLAGEHLIKQQEWGAAERAFDWVVKNSKDEGFKALAALQKASVQMQLEQWDAALSTVDGFAFPYEFRALKHDRRGDILQQQGKTQEAIAAYNAAYEAFDEWTMYRSAVEAKLNALGQKPAALAGV